MAVLIRHVPHVRKPWCVEHEGHRYYLLTYREALTFAGRFLQERVAGFN